MGGPLDHIAQVVTGSGQPVGMATLIQAEEGTLITCAHVVRTALRDQAFDPHTRPTATIALRWPQEPRVMAWASVLVEGWTSPDDFGGGDLAVLRLRSALPDDSYGAAFVAGVEVDGHRFHVYGAGSDDPAPVRTTGEIGGREGVGAAWRSLLTDERARKIEPGFSGAAVWDETLQYFVGMVVSREKGNDGHRSFFSPSGDLLRLWPKLDRVVRSPFEISSAARDHWLPRARGVTSAAESGWYFTGRDAAIDELTSALRVGRGDRYFAVTGRPGTGKSGLLARLPIIADPRLAQVARLTIDQVRLPGVWVIPIYLRQATAADFFDLLAKAVGSFFVSVDGFLDAVRSDRNLAHKQKLLVLDGLDEAADETARLRIARSIRQIAQTSALVNMTVVVSCRSGAAGSENAQLIDALGSKCIRVDVESTKYVHRADFRTFVERRLLDEAVASPYLGQFDKVATIAALVTARAYPNYLVAQLVTRALLDDPQISEAQLANRTFPSTVVDAFDEYLARFETDETRARHLMAGLAHARGAGFAAGELWLRVTHVVSGHRYDIADVHWLLQSAAAFLIETSDADSEPRYRLYHQALVDMLDGGKAAAVYEECVLAARAADVHGDGAYFRAHVSGHALAAERLSDLLLSPEALLCCSAQAVLDDSSRTDVALSEAAQRARAALRSIQHQLDFGRAEERSAYLAMAGHQFGSDALTKQTPTGTWWVHAAVWQASSDHMVLARGRPFTTVTYARIGEDEVAIAGDADGQVTFKSLDGTGDARPALQFFGSITHLSVTSADATTFLAVGTDTGEVHLVRVFADTTVRSTRVTRRDAPVVGLVLNCSGIHTRLVAAFADGSLHLDERRGLRHIHSHRARLEQPVTALTGLRGGRNTAAVVTPYSSFFTIRTEDLTPIDAPVEYNETVFQIFDSWHNADGESSALFSSWSGISWVGLEFGHVKRLIARRTRSRFVCTPISRQHPNEFVGSDGTSIVVHGADGGERFRLRGHADAVIDLAIATTAGGSKILSVADDGSLRLWDLSTTSDGDSETVAVQVLDLRPAPFGVLYRSENAVWHASADGERKRLGDGSVRARFNKNGTVQIGSRDQKQRKEQTREAEVGVSWQAERTAAWPLDLPLDDESWAQVRWRRNDLDYALFVRDTAIDIVRLDDTTLGWLHRATPGVSEAVGASEAVVSYIVEDKIFFFIADGTYLRVFDDHLGLVSSIAVAGGPARALRVAVVEVDGVLQAAFALRCESGLVAGSVTLP